MQGKIWGITEELFLKNGISVNRIEVHKGGFSSWHLHKHKYNYFYVEYGKVGIQSVNDGLEENIVLIKGDNTVISPGVKHRFVALEESVVYEIYYSEMKSEDITRFDKGGLNGL